MSGMQVRIAVDPDVMLGKPVIRGTRITVELILRKLSEGASEAELLEPYPHLTATDIRSAIKCALQLVERSWSSRASRQ